MLDSIFLENSAGGGASGGSASDGLETELRNDSGGSEGGGEGDFIAAGNRWPREETLALVKIRSDMDQQFRDASFFRSPLWDEVSRKLGELGFNRSPHKCKEKFENIYKYHKRTKSGSSSRQDGKNYKFSEQLEPFGSQMTTPSIPPHTETKSVEPLNFVIPGSYQDCMNEFMATYTSTSATSSSGISKKKKKELKDYFEKLMKDILLKQEELQKKFMEALEKYDKYRTAREEAWKAQEMARIKRERESLAQERAKLAAKDAAMLAFLKKLSNELPESLTQILSDGPNLGNEKSIVSVQVQENSGNMIPRSSSRWPKAEIDTLIMLKIDLDLKFQDNGPKGRLWDEISSCMKKVGYERSGKKCKEKWENINKYYKKVKDGKKRRAGDTKTCPYFNMLDSLYASKSQKLLTITNGGCDGGEDGGFSLKPEQILMQMMLQQKQPTPVIHQSGDVEMHDEDEFDGESEGRYQIAG